MSMMKGYTQKHCIENKCSETLGIEVKPHPTEFYSEQIVIYTLEQIEALVCKVVNDAQIIGDTRFPKYGAKDILTQLKTEGRI